VPGLDKSTTVSQIEVCLTPAAKNADRALTVAQPLLAGGDGGVEQFLYMAGIGLRT
jgi:hypothetical protein